MGSGCSSCSSECPGPGPPPLGRGPPIPTHAPPSHPSFSYNPVTQIVLPLHLAPIHPHHGIPTPHHPASPCSLDFNTAHSAHSDGGRAVGGRLSVSTGYSQPSLPQPLLPMSWTGSSPTLRSSRSPHLSSYWRRRRRPRSCTMLCYIRRRWETGGGVQRPRGRPLVLCVASANARSPGWWFCVASADTETIPGLGVPVSPDALL